MRPKEEIMKDLAKVRRRVIIIERKGPDTSDAVGNQIENWLPWKTLRAEKTQLWGQEYYAAAAVGQEQTVVFTLRRFPGLDVMDAINYRLLFEGRVYDIKHVDRLQDGSLWLKIKATLRPDGGNYG